VTDGEVITRARDLAEVDTIAKVRERFHGWNDDTAAVMEAFSVARYLLIELADRLSEASAGTG
jgi:hypothetical protein